MTKTMMFSRVEKSMHKDYVGEMGILVLQDGRTQIVDENTINDDLLEKMYKRLIKK